MKLVHIGKGSTPEWVAMLTEALKGQKVLSMAVAALYVPEGSEQAEPAVFTCAIADGDALPFTLIGALEVAKMEVLQGIDGLNDGGA